MADSPHPQRCILALNGGSSSIKFAVFLDQNPPLPLLTGEIERIGSGQASITVKASSQDKGDSKPIDASDHRTAANAIFTELRARLKDHHVVSVGHRIVDGGLNLIEHQAITPAVLQELKAVQPLDPAHLPREIALIEAVSQTYPQVSQVACFDTAFHHTMPAVAKLLPIPRAYLDRGIRKLGFHGISYTYLMQKLTELAGPTAASGKVVLAHLGSGASLAAVAEGKPVDTTMSFTPLAGLVMGTRPGDLDPGFLIYLLRNEKLSVDQVDQMLSKQCGMLGVSGTTADMRDLVQRRGSDPHAADAVALFCYQARKQIGGMAAAINGLNTLVFSGGIGEHSPEARAEICQGLGYLGVDINPAANLSHADVISTVHSKVAVRLIPTNEELVIAQTVRRLLDKPQSTA